MLIKRFFDIVFSLIGMLVLGPLIMILSVFVRIDTGGPVFFLQPRIGLNGKPFVLCKFKTMLNYTDKNGVQLPDEERLTRFGRLLRSTSLDELPELINIIKGDMSFVGPRPLLLKYLTLYTAEQARRHSIKPGLTGWAQVNGRNNISWEEKFRLDVWYVDNQSFELDLRIIFLTLGKVFSREGINQDGHATAKEFMGSSK